METTKSVCSIGNSLGKTSAEGGVGLGRVNMGQGLGWGGREELSKCVFSPDSSGL